MRMSRWREAPAERSSFATFLFARLSVPMTVGDRQGVPSAARIVRAYSTRSEALTVAICSAARVLPTETPAIFLVTW